MDHLYNKRVAYHTGCIPVFWFAIAKRGGRGYISSSLLQTVCILGYGQGCCGVKSNGTLLDTLKLQHWSKKEKGLKGLGVDRTPNMAPH
jgi:hypothetical protein